MSRKRKQSRRRSSRRKSTTRSSRRKSTKKSRTRRVSSTECSTGKKDLTLISITKSPKKEKKLRATFCNKGRVKHVDFGASGYSDFTIHKDPARKERYKNRHSAREDFDAPMTPGALSLWILWNKTTVRESIKDYKRRFKL